MDGYNDRVAAVFGALEPSLASKTDGDGQSTVPDHDREEGASTSHRESQNIYIPPAKRRDTRSASDSHLGDRSDHRRERRLREHDGRDSGREQRRRHDHGGRGGRHSRAHRDPDYLRNPSKWTKYDLKDDGSQVLRGMSQDQVNKYAAFQFLDEIKKRKSSSSLTMQDSDGTDNTTESDNPAEMTKVVFKRPSRSVNKSGKQSRTGLGDSLRKEDGDLKTKGQEVHSASDGSGGGIKMAEYVVGSKAAAQLHRERRRQRKVTQLVSLHSEEELEEEEGAGDMDSGDIAEIGGGGTKAVKKRTSATINLSHLEEEENT